MVSISKVERIAKKAVMQFDSNIGPISDLNAYKSIPGYGGGTLVLIEFTDPGDPTGNTVHEFQVVVRGAVGEVFTDFHTVYSEAVKNQKNMLLQLTGPDVFAPFLTLVLVVSFLVFAWDHQELGEMTVAKTLSAAITSVIAFWFGRQTVR
jgi:hypothetical protein